jgi:hypothetical protein
MIWKFILEHHLRCKISINILLTHQYYYSIKSGILRQFALTNLESLIPECFQHHSVLKLLSIQTNPRTKMRIKNS